MELKYIITKRGPVLFSKGVVHSDAARGMQEVSSAGFVKIFVDEATGLIDCHTYGESISLKLFSQDGDSDRIKLMLQTGY